METNLPAEQEKTKLVLSIDPVKYGLEKNEAEQIQAVFVPMLEKLKELEDEYNEIVIQEVTPELAEKAKTLRLKLVKVRTGTDAIHKKAKQYYLNGGRAVDGLKNTVTFAVEGKEDILEGIEMYYENQEKERLDKIYEVRVSEVQALGGAPIAELRTMKDEIYKDYIFGINAAKEAKEKAAKKEEQRLKKEAKEKAAADKAAAEEQARIKAENEKLKAEVDAAAKLAADEKAKQEAENKKLQDKLSVEKDARIKAENQLQVKQGFSISAFPSPSAKEVDQDQKVKLTGWVDEFKQPDLLDSKTLKDKKLQSKQSEISAKFEAFKRWAKEEIKNA